MKHHKDLAALILGLVLSLAISRPDRAAEEAPAASDGARPKIGLVLGGGGARGGAHIGILKVLEELRVPVDFVVGTSIGSIVGGLYSSGMSPAEMEKMVGETDWGSIFSDKPERQRISFRRKQDDDLALFPFEVGIGKKGLSARSGIISGTRIDFFFRSLTLEASGITNFDDLRVPFRAVAADLISGEPVILDHGDLTTAMRASMSIPGVFTPVEIDGRFLVDGGMALNLPVDVARALGAARIIAVDVGTPPKSSARGLSTVGVFNQMISLMGQKNVDEQRARLGEGDLLITPELGDIGMADFSKIGTAVAAGEAAARQHEAALRSFSVSEQGYRAVLEKQRRHGGAPSVLQAPIGSVRVEVLGADGSRQVSDILTRRLDTRPGRPLDESVLARDLDGVSQGGEFESVNFRLLPSGDRSDLVIQARHKSWGPGYLRFGLAVDSNVEGNTRFRALVHYRRPELNELGAEWRSLVSLGNPAALDTEFFQPLQRSGFLFVAPWLSLSRERLDFYQDTGDFETVDQSQGVAGVDFGVLFRNYGEIRLGALRGRLKLEPASASTLTAIEPDLGGARLRMTLDQIDNAFFPTHGNQTRVSAFASRRSLGADDEYDKIDGYILQAWTAARGTLVGSVELGTDLGSNLPVYDQFELGGFLNFSGLPRGFVRGDVKFLTRLINYWRISRLSNLARSYLGLGVEAGNVWDDASEAATHDLRYSGLAFWGLDTKLSPVYLGYGFAEGGNRSMYVFIGLPFKGGPI
jgi:NTE family protein